MGTHEAIPKDLLLKGAVGIYSQLAQLPERSKALGSPLLLPQLGTTSLVGVESKPTCTLFIQGPFISKDLRTRIDGDTATRYKYGASGA